VEIAERSNAKEAAFLRLSRIYCIVPFFMRCCCEPLASSFGNMGSGTGGRKELVTKPATISPARLFSEGKP
jgi:hypothetical protein